MIKTKKVFILIKYLKIQLKCFKAHSTNSSGGPDTRIIPEVD